METKITQNNTKSSLVYILASYDDEEGGFDIVRVYTSLENAKKKLIDIVRTNFVSCGGIIEDYPSESQSDNTDDSSESEGSNIPGFDKTNWDHMKSFLTKEIEECDGYLDYENKYGYPNRYKICKEKVYK